jgi:hypothetical protein
MYKFIISAFSMLFITTVFLEADNKSYSFVGVETSLSLYDDISAPSFGIKYGKQGDMLRTTIELSHAQNGQNKLETLMMEVDRGILTSLFQKSPIQPYVGVNYGFIQHNNNQKDRGYLYGLSLGVSYILSHSMDLNLASQLLKTSKMNDIKDLKNISLSLHYFY